MKPPALGARILARFCPPGTCDDVLADLNEEYLRFKVPELGRFRARLWYWHQAVGSIIAYGRHRNGRTSRPRGSVSRRRTRVATALGSVVPDVRYALRSLRKTPGFTAAVVVTLAVGIGATATVFSAVDIFLFRALPYDEPDRLVDVYGIAEERGWDYFSQALPDYFDIREQSRTMRVAGWRPASFNLAGGERPERIVASRVSWNFFEVLRVRLALGRSFAADEERAGNHHVVVISDGLWQRRFGADPEIIGTAILLDGEPHTVIGVLSPSSLWIGGVGAELWTPFGIANRDEGRSSHNMDILGRLAPGATIEQAHEEVSRIAARLAIEYPATNAGWGAGARPLREFFFADSGRDGGLISFVAVGMLLLIACANVANLMLTRATGRSREMAVRGALGAAKWRIARQLLTESMVLSLIGGTLGLLVAAAGIYVLAGLSAASLVGEVSLNGRVLLFTLATTTFTGLLFGLAPVTQSLREDAVEPLKQGAPGTTSVRGGRLRRALVVSEIALALTLLVTCALLAGSFVSLRVADFGWHDDRLLTFRVALPEADYPDGEMVLGFHHELLERLRALPGVDAVGGINFLPLREMDETSYTVEGAEPASGAARLSVSHRLVFPGYFEAMGIRLVAGRMLEATDRPAGQPVVVINEAMCDRHWPDGDPLGKQITLWDETREIVGVVSNTKDRGPAARTPMVFWSALQRPTRSMAFVVRTTVEPTSLSGAIRAEVGNVDADLPVYEVMTMDDVWWAMYSGDGILAAIMVVSAGIALTLALVGVYGVTSHAVASRSHELGVRIALGARRVDVLGMVIRQGTRLAILGILLGTLIAAVVSLSLSETLFGVDPLEPLIFIGGGFALLVAAVTAVCVPARRATRVDPMVAIRAE